jgi:Protein of unknown function (DUF2794)
VIFISLIWVQVNIYQAFALVLTLQKSLFSGTIGNGTIAERFMEDASTINIFDLTGPHQTAAATNSAVYIVRTELIQILNIYGKMVAAGEWHDYAIDTLKDLAIFSIFRRASEMPMYRIIKEPSLANKQGMWRITSMDGSTLKRGKQLDILLRYFDRKLVKAVP